MNIKKLLKNYHVIFLMIMFILMLIIHHFVLPQGDDYYHSTAISGTVREFFDFHINHYMRGNGRAIIHFLLTLFFGKNGFELWRILNPLVFVLVAILSAKFAEKKENFNIAVSSLCVLYLCLGGKFTSNSIFTLTPVFNYVYPFLLMLPLIYLVSKIYDCGKKYSALPILGFFAGATMEQTGIMSIGYIVLIAFFKFIEESKKPTKTIYYTLIATIVGYATVMLAPGNFVRMETSTKPFFENFVAAFTMLINTKSFVVFNLFLIASYCYRLITIKTKYKLIRICNLMLVAALCVGYCVNVFILYNSMGIGFESIPVLSLLWRAFDLAYIFAMVYTPILITVRLKKNNYLMHSIIALGSIIILFFASVSEWRPLTPAIMIWFIYIMQTFIDMRNEHPKLAASTAIVTVALSLCMFFVGFCGYRDNYKIDVLNKERVSEYMKKGDYSIPLVLLPNADTETAGYSIYDPSLDTESENDEIYSYTSGYKRFYGIPDSVKIIIEK